MRESLRFTLHRPPKDASSIAAIEHFWQFAETMPFPLARYKFEQIGAALARLLLDVGCLTWQGEVRLGSLLGDPRVPPASGLLYQPL